ncbi:uncharacterized protein LOC143041080 isoform X2 [Oratosquilla oratoria]
MSGWEKEKENLVEKLEHEYAECLSAVGQAHKNAAEQPRVSEVLAVQAKQNRYQATLRGHAAGKRAKELQNEKDKKCFAGIVCRKKAIHIEKIRAKQITNLPTPEVFKPKIVSKPKPVPLVLKHEAGTFITSAYAPASNLVEKEIISTFPNAKLRAKKEQKALEAEAEERARENEATKKKVNERGKIALQQERTKNLYQELLGKLENAKKNHDLSMYLEETDFNLFETEEQRLVRLSKLQKDMEEAVEKVLEESDSHSTSYDKSTSHSESTDCKETSNTPDNTDSSVLSKIGDLQDLLRKIREYRESVIESNDGGSTRISCSDSDSSRNISGKLDIISKEDRKGKVTLPVIEEDKRQEWVHERVGEEILPETESTTTEMPCSSTSEDRVEDDLNQDIHLAETVAIDRLENKNFDEQKLHTYQGTEVREYAPIEDIVSSTGISEEENSSSSEQGLELRILIDPGHCTPKHSSETQVYGGHFKDRKSQTIHKKKMYEKELPKDVDHKKLESSSSTSYLSLPSRLHAKTMDDIGANLRQLQSQRPKIQQMLDDLTSAVPLPSHSTPITTQNVHPRLYKEELKEEGSGKRPVKKKHKFEFHRKQILKQYAERLIAMKQNEVQQISASTVNSSGLTISSLGQLSAMAEKNYDTDSDKSSGSQSSSVSESISSSSLISQCDTDKVPTKLSCSMNQSEENSHSALTNDQVFPSHIHNHSSKHLNGKETTPLAPGFPVTEEYDSSLSVVEPSRKGSSRSVDDGCVENLRKQWQLVEKILELQSIKKKLLQQQEAAIANERLHPELDIEVPERDIPSSYPRIKEVHQSSVRERKVAFRSSSSGDGDQIESKPIITLDGSYQTPPLELGSSVGGVKDRGYIEQWQYSKTDGVSVRSHNMKASKSLDRDTTTVTHSISDSGQSRRLDNLKASLDFSSDKSVPESVGETEYIGRITTNYSTVHPQQPFFSRANNEPKGSSGTQIFYSYSGCEGISKEKALNDQKFTLSQNVSQSLSSSKSSQTSRSDADKSSSSGSMPDMTAVLERFGVTMS